MANWTRGRLTALRHRASGIGAQATTTGATSSVPIEVGGPFVTALDIQAAAEGIEEILTAYRAGTATPAQLRAIWAVNDSNADAREQLDTGATDAAYGAGIYQGYQAGYDPAAAQYAGDYPEPQYPEPDAGPEV